MAGWLRRWWLQVDHFDWLSSYVQVHRLRMYGRLLVAGITAALATVPLAMLASPAGPRTTTTRVLTLAVTATGLVLALVWLAAWPSRRTSLTYSIVISPCIAVASLVQSQPFIGLLGCAAFAVLGGYIAFFHTAAWMTYNFAIAAVTVGMLSVRGAFHEDLVLAGCALAVIVALNVAVPLALQSLVHLMSVDIVHSRRDPLTGLLNRRAFHESAQQLVTRNRDPKARWLIVAMIDLDNFKRVNDTHGHLAGDRALMDVGAVLRNNCRAGAVIARAGGEEFLIADIADTLNGHAMAERLRAAIAGISTPVTASIGTATVVLDDATRDDVPHVISQLIGSADAAMYEAKRAGGTKSVAARSIRPIWPELAQ
ncbi:hypothetical protein A5712_24300 [Mycobacterium sp. E2327]|nr:hypothetical protein A5712_24300 [Mycobacterium sp. E2327]